MNDLKCSDRKTHGPHEWDKTWLDKTVVTYKCQGHMNLNELLGRMGAALFVNDVHEFNCPNYKKPEAYSRAETDECTCVWKELADYAQ